MPTPPPAAPEPASPVRLVVVVIALTLTGLLAVAGWRLIAGGWHPWLGLGTGALALLVADSWWAATRPGGAWPVWVRLLALA